MSFSRNWMTAALTGLLSIAVLLGSPRAILRAGDEPAKPASLEQLKR